MSVKGGRKVKTEKSAGKVKRKIRWEKEKKR